MHKSPRDSGKRIRAWGMPAFGKLTEEELAKERKEGCQRNRRPTVQHDVLETKKETAPSAAKSRKTILKWRVECPSRCHR